MTDKHLDKHRSQSCPIISIGMPVFNCATTVAYAICSILNQTFKDWELLIVDDGSTDNTMEIAALFDDPRIILIRGGVNKRLPTRLNECVSRARGRYFARMDGDDIAYPGRLECQLEFLQSHPDVDIAGGCMVVFRDEGTAFGTRRSPLNHAQICASPWRNIPMAHPTWMGKVEWFRRYQYLTVAAAEDQELLFRAYQNSQFANVPKIVLGYRENRLSLEYILFQRRHICKRIILNAGQQRRYMRGALGVISQIAKAVIDIIAICTGLNYYILRHRSPPILAEEKIEWNSVWQQVGITYNLLLTGQKPIFNISQSSSV